MIQLFPGRSAETKLNGVENRSMMPDGAGHDRTQQVLFLLPEQEVAIVEDPGRELPVDL